MFATTTDSIVSGAAEGELYSNLCSGTRAAAGGDIPSAFGGGQPPSEVSTAESGASSGELVAPSRGDADSSFPKWVLLAFAVVAVGGAGTLLARRRTRNARG